MKVGFHSSSPGHGEVEEMEDLDHLSKSRAAPTVAGLFYRSLRNSQSK